MPTLILFPIAAFLIFEFADIFVEKKDVCTEKQIYQNEGPCGDVSKKDRKLNE